MLQYNIRYPAVAGMFYPASPPALEHDIQRMFDQAGEREAPADIVALVSPHAGFLYSGSTAACGYKLLRGHSFDTVVIVSPSHREYFNAVSVYEGNAYRTPIGAMIVDKELRDQLAAADKLIEISSRGHGTEHAIEVQLPFLQQVLGKVNILPIVMGDQQRDYCFRLGESLGKVLAGKKVLLVASTDLSHYYPYDVANKFDQIAIDDVARFDYEKLMTDLELEKTEACGGGPTVAVMIAARRLGANKVDILAHCNSGDVTGDRTGVVGYLSACIFRSN